ncbi:MAG TPA: hypothetical protein VNH18_15280, partial [Bryobacteraceae bacterium]|nr:hypothetical protein [Bryobacteraceae bacterium]
VGTEGYLPPEGPGTVSADVFSLGKVLYEISTGRDRQQFPELPTRVHELPDRADLVEFNEVLVRACAPSPKQRYVSAAEMHADLALLQSGKSVSRMRAVERRLLFVQRAGAVVTAVAALAAGLYLWQARQTARVTELAEKNRRLAEEKSTLATEKTKLADNLARVAEENRQRVVRLDVANGVRHMNGGDFGGALLWFTEALRFATNSPTEDSVHRIRIQQVLNRIPRLHHVLPHDDNVTTAAFSDDGQRVVTGTGSHLRVWDAHSGADLSAPLAFGADSVHQLRFTRDGRHLFASSLPVSGFRDQAASTNIAAIIEAETGRSIVSLSASNLVRAALTKDDRWLITADTEHVIHAHDALDGSQVGDFLGHTNRILQFAFSETGEVMASSSEAKPARFQIVWLCRLPSGEPLGPPILCARGPIALSPDGRLLVSLGAATDGAADSILQTWDISTSGGVGVTTRIPGTLAGLWFVSRSGREVCVLTDKQCSLMDARTHQSLWRPLQPPAEAEIASVSPDGRLVAFGGKQGLAGVWSFENGEMMLPPFLRDSPLTDLQFSPDGMQLVVTSISGTATLLSSCLLREDGFHRFDATLARGRQPHLLEPQRFSPGRRHTLLALDDGSVRLVDFETLTDERVPSAQSARLRPLKGIFDTSGQRGAIYYENAGTNRVEMWNNDGETTHRFVLSHPMGEIEEIIFTADGSNLLASSTGGRILVWNTADGTL